MKPIAASTELTQEWETLIQEQQVPERVKGELTLNEFVDFSGLKKTKAERILKLLVKEGKIIRHPALIDGKAWNVYRWVLAN